MRGGSRDTMFKLLALLALWATVSAARPEAWQHKGPDGPLDLGQGVGAELVDAASVWAVQDADLYADPVMDHIFGGSPLAYGMQDGNSSHPNCTVYCNDDQLDTSLATVVGSERHHADCWGTFRVWCKGHTNHSCGHFGLKNEGHFLALKTEHDARVVVAEGLFKHFSVVYFKHNGTGVKVVKGAGCAGTAAAVMHGNHTHGNSSAAAAALAWEQLPDSFLDGLDEQSEATAMEYWARDEGSSETVAEGRCMGMGGRFKGVKKLDEGDRARGGDDANAGDDLAKLEGKLNGSLAEAAMQLLPSDDVVPASWGVHSLAHLAGPGIACRLTCNGKDPWFKGIFPCWGVSRLHCVAERHHHDDDDERSPPAHPHAPGLLSHIVALAGAGTPLRALAKLGPGHQERRRLHEHGWKHGHGEGGDDMAAWSGEGEWWRKFAEGAAAEAEAEGEGEGHSHHGHHEHWDEEEAHGEGHHGHGKHHDKHHEHRWEAEAEGAEGEGAEAEGAGGSEGVEGHSGPGRVLRFDVSCKGFYSGFFGHTCAGFTSEHVEFKGADMWSFCTGKHGAQAKGSREGFAMGSWCRGKHLSAFQVSEDEE